MAQTKIKVNETDDFVHSSEGKSMIGSFLSAMRGNRNVASWERWAGGIGGGLLSLYGLRRNDWEGAVLALFGGGFVYRSLTGHSFLYQTLRINTNSQEHTATSVADQESIKVERAVTIFRSPADLYRYWRNFENLPQFMGYLKSVTVTDPTHSHWVATAPAGTTVEWDAAIINERENELIAWRSLAGAEIGNAGSVHFIPSSQGRGTIVRVVLAYDPPAGKLGATIAKLFGQEPDQQVREALRHFKAIMEAGEVPSTKGQTSGRQ